MAPPRGLGQADTGESLLFRPRQGDTAAAEYYRVREDREAGREPRAPNATAATVGEVLNRFLHDKRDGLEIGDLTPATWEDYRRSADHAIRVLGRDRAVCDLTPADFGKLRKVTAQRLGPTALKKYIVTVRGFFRHALKNRYIDRPADFGSLFDLPDESKLRLAKEARGIGLDRGKVRLGFTAPRDVVIDRYEVLVAKAAVFTPPELAAV